jgi:hypothetical protein
MNFIWFPWMFILLSSGSQKKFHCTIVKIFAQNNKNILEIMFCQ